MALEEGYRLDDSPNPFGIIHLPSGGQFSEARSFLRIYGRNPYAQEALLMTLVGLHKTMLEGVLTSDDNEIESIDEFDTARRALVTVISFLDRSLPEWRRDDSQNESLPGLGPYRVDDFVVQHVDSILEELDEG